MIRKAVVIYLVIIIFCLNGCAGKKEKIIAASGNIEATEIQVAAETSGRLLMVNAGEGDKINKGDLLAKVDASTAALKLKEADAVVKEAEAGLKDLKTGARRQEIREAQATVDQAQAKKQAALLEASNTAEELERIKELFNSGAVSEQELDRIRTLHEVSQVKLDEAEANFKAARARADLVRAGATSAALEAMEAKLKQALAIRELAARQMELSSIKAPVGGVVLRQNFQEGEMVNPGTPVMTLADLKNLWVTVYIPEPDLGRVQLGQEVMIRVDAFPRDTFKGKVIFIAPEAEFTPKNVVTVSERVKTVFAVKVALDSDKEKLKPGMPADVEFLPVGGYQ